MSGKWFVQDDGHEFWWPDCAVSGCPNQACLRKNSPFCWPHTPGAAVVDEIMDQALARPKQGQNHE